MPSKAVGRLVQQGISHYSIHSPNHRIFYGQQLQRPSFLYTGKCPLEWAKTFLPLVKDCEHREDYEAAQATSDAIMEFLNQFLPADQQLNKETDILKLPEYKEIVIYWHISY